MGINLEVSQEEINSGVKKANALNGTADEINEILTSVSNKQDTLVSGTNIKTVNNLSLLGEGNITIEGGGSGSVEVDNKTISKNASNQIQTIGIVNSADSSMALKTWIGDNDAYNALATKDTTTIYNVVGRGIFLGEQATSVTTEQLDEKVDIANLIEIPEVLKDAEAVIKTTYISGTSGYRIWTDGYCEQWGLAVNTSSTSYTLTFTKTFANTNYNFVFANPITTGGAISSEVGSRTNNSVVIKNTSGGKLYDFSVGISWRACGYLAVGEY